MIYYHNSYIKTGVTILNYNNANACYKLAEEFCGYNSFDIIVIVDNNSSDNSCEILKNSPKHEKLHIVYNQENGGYAKGNNIGLKYLEKQQCDFLFVANPDIHVNDYAVEKTILFLLSHCDYGMAAPRILEWNGDPAIIYQEHIVTLKEAVLSNFLTRKYVVERKIAQPEKDQNGYCKQSFLYGSFWGATAESLKKCNYMDEGTFLYREEEILALRMRRIGLKLAYLMDVSFIHNHPYKQENRKKRLCELRRLQTSDYYMWHTYYNLTFIQEIFLKASYAFCQISHYFAYLLEDLKNGNK